MRKLFIIVTIFVLSVNLWAEMKDYSWTLNYAQYKEGVPWHATDGNWQLYRTIYFDDMGLVYNRKNQVIGAYWLIHLNNMIIKIDSDNRTIYGSFRYMDNSVIMCGTGEIYQNRKLTVLKFIMVRTIKHKK